LNITMAAPSVRLLDEIGVAAGGRLAFVRRLIGHQLALVVASLGLRLRDATPLGLRMRQSVIDGCAVFRHLKLLCRHGATPAAAAG
jgi:hypothetical protein